MFLELLINSQNPLKCLKPSNNKFVSLPKIQFQRVLYITHRWAMVGVIIYSKLVNNIKQS